MALVGHSLGGLVAFRLAIDSPDFVAPLLLLDQTSMTPPRALRTMAPFLKFLAGLGPPADGCGLPRRSETSAASQ